MDQTYCAQVIYTRSLYKTKHILFPALLDKDRIATKMGAKKKGKKGGKKGKKGGKKSKEPQMTAQEAILGYQLVFTDIFNAIDFHLLQLNLRSLRICILVPLELPVSLLCVTVKCYLFNGRKH